MPIDVLVGLGVQLGVQIVVIAFFYGKLAQRSKDVEARVGRIEQFIDYIVKRTIHVDFKREG